MLDTYRVLEILLLEYSLHVKVVIYIKIYIFSSLVTQNLIYSRYLILVILYEKKFWILWKEV